MGVAARGITWNGKMVEVLKLESAREAWTTEEIGRWQTEQRPNNQAGAPSG